MLVVWTERKFNFDFPAELFETILMRLRHAPLRYRTETAGLSDDAVSLQRDGKWSIKENVGHIPSLDATLWTQRLEQFLGNADELVGADMTNMLTSDAGYNFQPLEEIHELLKEERTRFVARLDALSPAEFALTAHHPRLNKPMRLVDMLLFIAEHDDYHLAHIRNLRGKA